MKTFNIHGRVIFEFKTVIEGKILNPSSMCIDDSKLYVNDYYCNYVAVLSIPNLKFIKTISFFGPYYHVYFHKSNIYVASETTVIDIYDMNGCKIR